MTDTKPTAELPPCKRRLVYRTPDGEKVQCKPATSDGIDPRLAIKNPAYFRTREITIDECYRCQGKPVPPPAPKSKEKQVNPRTLPDGSIAYPKRGWEPPAVPKGYKRKSDNLESRDAWIMIPIMVNCVNRTQETIVAPCGKVSIQYHCKLHGRVTAKRCKECRDGM